MGFGLAILWLWISNNFGAGATHNLQMIANQLLLQIMGGEDQDCELISFHHTLGNEGQEQILINLKRLEDSTKQNEMRVFLQKNTKCSFALGYNMTSKLLLQMSSLVNMTWNSKLVSLYGEEPAEEVLMEMRRPLIWLQEVSKENSIVKLFCPTVEHPRRTRNFTIGVCKKFHCRFTLQARPLKSLSTSTLCASPLWGQKMNFVTFFAYPLTVHTSRIRPELSGWTVRLNQLIARKYDMHLDIYVTVGKSVCLKYSQNDVTKRWTELAQMTGEGCKVIPSKDIIYGHSDMHTYDQLTDYDPGPQVTSVRPNLVTRYPIPVSSFGEILKPFSLAVWICVLLTSLVLCIMFFAAYKMYQHLEQGHLIRHETCTTNFVLFPLCKVTEPEPLKWFGDKWSTGKMLVFLWSIQAFFLPIAYMSLLRAHMMLVTREKAPETLQDVVVAGRRVWIPDRVTSTRLDFLEATGQNQSVIYKVAKLAEATGGYYDPAKFKGLDPNLVKGIPEGELVSFWPETLTYLSQDYPETFARWNVHIVKEFMEAKHTQLFVMGLKYSPVMDDARFIGAVMIESGLIRKYLLEYLTNNAILKPQPDNVELSNLALRNLGTSFLFWAGALLASTVVFAFEKMSRKKRRSADETEKLFTKRLPQC